MIPYWSDCIDSALLLDEHEQVSRAVIGESVPGGKVGQTRLQTVSQLCPYNCAAELQKYKHQHSSHIYSFVQRSKLLLTGET